MSRFLLDTSVLIADASGRGHAELPPGEAAVSIVTLAELELGVQLAADPTIRAQRLETLSQVRLSYEAIEIDERAASAFARITASLRREGERAGIQDTWIAATAVANSAVVCTQDAGFDVLGHIGGIEIMKV